MIPVSGLWSGKDKNENFYLSGNFGNAKVMVFKNNFKKEGDSKPDFIMYFDKKQKKEEGETQEAQTQPTENEDDLPF